MRAAEPGKAAIYAVVSGGSRRCRSQREWLRAALAEIESPGVVRQPGQPLRVWVLGPDTLTSRSDLASAQDPEHQALRILGVLKAIKSRLGYG